MRKLNTRPMTAPYYLLQLVEECGTQSEAGRRIGVAGNTITTWLQQAEVPLLAETAAKACVTPAGKTTLLFIKTRTAEEKKLIETFCAGMKIRCMSFVD